MGVTSITIRWYVGWIQAGGHLFGVQGQWLFCDLYYRIIVLFYCVSTDLKLYIWMFEWCDFILNTIYGVFCLAFKVCCYVYLVFRLFMLFNNIFSKFRLLIFLFLLKSDFFIICNCLHFIWQLNVFLKHVER